MRKPVAVLVIWIAAAGLAAAQAPESVTVTGTKEREVARGFVDSVAVPTHFIGKLARWEVPICPYTVGIKPEAAQFVTDRVKAVAAEVGAPVSTDAKCTFNIEIVFTKTPQALLDDMKKNQPALLGYQSSSEELDRLATFNRPIEVRYTTATKDLRGKVEIDSARTISSGQGLTLLMPCVMLGRKFEPPGKICTQQIPQARKVNVTGARLGDGLRSNFYHIVIVVDPRQIAGEELGAVSDYIAMLALTQLGSLETCQTLPSIVNLLAKDCANPPGGMTVTDRGYLRGLYRMQADMSLVVQKNEIASEMAKAAE
jgi:hypothetical protein